MKRHAVNGNNSFTLLILWLALCIIWKLKENSYDPPLLLNNGVLSSLAPKTSCQINK